MRGDLRERVDGLGDIAARAARRGRHADRGHPGAREARQHLDGKRRFGIERFGVLVEPIAELGRRGLGREGAGRACVHAARAFGSQR